MVVQGYTGRMDVSGDGEQSWHSLRNVSTGTLTETPTTESAEDWDSDGDPNTQIIGEEVTVSIECYVETGNTALEILRRLKATRQFASIRYYNNKKILSQYTKFRAVVTSIEKTNAVGSFATYAIEMTARGLPQHVEGFIVR